MDTWGTTPKSQVDDETINEAIDSAILAHESDPTAHLGEGEALQAHKTESIVDHPAGSILADKWTMSQMDFTTQFENLTQFTTHGIVTNQFPGVQIKPSGVGDSNYGRVYFTTEDAGGVFNPEKESLVQLSLNADTYHTGLIIFQFGFAIGELQKRGMGFYIQSGVLKFFLAQSDGTGYQEMTITGWSDVSDRIIRIHNDPAIEKVRFYLDGELKGELWWNDPTDVTAFGSGFSCRQNTGDYTVANIYSMYFAFEPTI